jgi:hypothetical protein
MAGQPTAATLSTLQQSGTEHEELLSRWLDLQLSAVSQDVDFSVWNVILQISKPEVTLPQ